MPEPQRGFSTLALADVRARLNQRFLNWQNRQRVARLARQVAAQAHPDAQHPPVVLFNASTRLTGLSLNASFSLLTGWMLRLAGIPVIHWVCQAGLRPCVLGTNRQDYTALPPCQACMAQSQWFYQGADVRSLHWQADPELEAILLPLNMEALSVFEYVVPFSASPIPLGRLVLPSIRWALRRHHLPQDETVRYLLRQYIQSAYGVAVQFNALLDQVRPAAVVIFNGSMYPEATARWVARQHGLPSFTHEVGFQRLSTFFTDGEATAYPMRIPPDFELTPEQNARLDAYLEQRFQGQFTMAGIQFWREMHGLDPVLLQHMASFQQVVPVFTNVIYDTSQAHANAVFPHMFAWLDLILEMIRAHPETLFVLRAHPDEMRPDSAKKSNESVRDWVGRNAVTGLPNVVFIDSQEYVSSYELIQRSKFVIAYNSSIGLEAALLGKAVVCGGRSRYTDSVRGPAVFFPHTPAAFQEQCEAFLAAACVEPPLEFQLNARRFMYFQLYHASLPLDQFLEVGQRQGFVRLKRFSWQDLLLNRPEASPALQILYDGILNGRPFLWPDR